MCKRWIGGVVLGLLSMVSTANAWSSKQHIMITRLAALELMGREDVPEDLKQWLRVRMPEGLSAESIQAFYFNEKQDAVPVGVTGLSYSAVLPDLVAMNSKELIAGYGLAEGKLHYIDLEMFATGELEGKYKDDLSALPKMDQIPRDLADGRWAKAGVLPFRLEESYRNLVKAFATAEADVDVEASPAVSANGDLMQTIPATTKASTAAATSQSAAGQGLMGPISTGPSASAPVASTQPASTQPSDLAMYWAGYLAHYAADNTQPQHATVDYRSGSYFASVSQGVRVPSAHWLVEWASDNDEAYLPVRQDVWKALTDELAQPTEPMPAMEDPWIASLQVSYYSYEALPMVGRAAVTNWNRDAVPLEKNEVGAIDVIKFSASTGTFHGREMTISQMHGRQMALAVRLVEAYWLKAWAEAHGK